jgi:hypothetical protein
LLSLYFPAQPPPNKTCWYQKTLAQRAPAVVDGSGRCGEDAIMGTHRWSSVNCYWSLRSGFVLCLLLSD